ncbi:DegV family protein [Latilactobacillus sakei]|nr:DegV family protein [Latilactobacillus sakei]AUX10916.1 DegV family protein [Latilactobacillus sakei]
MKTAIVTDSAAYLDPEVAQANKIIVVPITVIFGQQTYLENIEISTTEFYEKMRTTDKLPTTSQITMGQMQMVFDQLIADGFDEVICIHLSSGITSFIDNLQAYACQVEGITVYPFDSKVTSAGEAFLALEAARLVAQGEHAETIMPKLATLRETIGVYFVVDDLSHLMRTGRISNGAAFVGNLLRIKPILSFDTAGKIVALTKERTKKRAFQKVLTDFEAAVAAADYPIRACVIDGNNPEESAQWVETLTAKFPGMPIETSHIGPVVGVHTGEKVMGIIWGRDYLI